jgi:FkbH-like protein
MYNVAERLRVIQLEPNRKNFAQELKMKASLTASPRQDLLREVCAPDLFSRSIDEIGRLATRLRRARSAAQTEENDQSGRTAPIKVAVISSFLTDYLAEMLNLMLERRGIDAVVTSAGYGQLINEILTTGPTLAAHPDLAFFLPCHRDLRLVPAPGAGRDAARQAVKDEAGFWIDIASRIGCPTVMLSFDLPPHRPLGEADGLLPGGLGWHIRQVNFILAEGLPASVSLVDSEAMQVRMGAHAHDPRLYALCKQPFAMDALPEVADTLAAAAAALMGRARKVLVLDLDHTIWGGVVGDVGIEGLALGPETAEGEAFIEFQRYALALSRRGVILAVCSKNNEGVARHAFRSHPAMVLRDEDIACFIANFDDKATNIRRIAQTLNVGLDSLVFADDNPVERAWVSQQLPEVMVIDMPEDPSGYCAAVELAKAFPMYRLTQEDLRRSASYRLLAEAKTAASNATDIEGFLQELEPVLTIERVDGGTLDRIVQLIGKTNQFKLNPNTFTHDEVRDVSDNVLALRLSDRLQDYGIVSIAVTELEGRTLVVRNWVMSCRVFSRRLEHAMRVCLADLARSRGALDLALHYQASPKNGLVPAALTSIGFTDLGDGLFAAAAPVPATLAPHYMKLVDRRETALIHQGA